MAFFEHYDAIADAAFSPLSFGQAKNERVASGNAACFDARMRITESE
jgi:hypothetical protein